MMIIIDNEMAINFKFNDLTLARITCSELHHGIGGGGC